MAENTLISWADDTLNIWTGCTRISNGPLGACVACYAANLMDNRMHRVKFGGPGEGVGTRDEMKDWRGELRRIERKADQEYRETGRQRFVFINSLSDFFDNHPDCGPWRQAFFDEIRALPKRGHGHPHMVLLLLTKRPQNIIRMSKAAGGLPAICALGTTTENQTTLTLNGAALLAAMGVLRDLDDTPALFGFLSCEPLMEALDLSVLGANWSRWIQWVITGGETDQGKHRARPSSIAWFRSIRLQTEAAGAVYHHKQNGEYVDHFSAEANHFRETTRGPWPADMSTRTVRVGQKLAGRRLDGEIHDGRPAA